MNSMAGKGQRHWTTNIGQAAGHPAAFLFVIVYAALWLAFSPATFEWNAVATLAVFVMTLFIQRANRRDNLALHAKLDELVRVEEGARSELTQLDEEEPEVIERHRDEEVQKAEQGPQA
jgi:low affinity Fe/Cu permease